MAVVISIVNQKGGVGKTTTAINLSASLAQSGYSTLLIDLDPQANTTTGLGMSARTDKTVYDCLQEDAAIQDVALPTEIPRLSVVPASIDLAGAEIELVSVLARETRLRRALESSLPKYDFIVIDSPPSLGLLTINSLAAADRVIVPVQCEFYALTGLAQLLKTLSLVRRSLNSTVEVLGVVLTMYDARTRLSEEVAIQLREHFKGRVFNTVIPRNIRLTEAPSHGKPVSLYAPESRGAQAYCALAVEVAALTSKESDSQT
jgi:chromosome partitioning protein